MASMTRLTDLSFADLQILAGDASRAAVREAFAAGRPVAGSRDGRRVRVHPDGRVDDLGPVADLQAEPAVKASPPEPSTPRRALIRAPCPALSRR